ncbi:hypothetical protein BHM03_00005506 [Ensete ventricosum]|nr:hypothetical protein BHM03_00005506 [Ensete ventricosum]
MIGARHLCCSLLTADPETFKISEVARAGNRVRGTRIWPFESPVISRITRLMEDEHPSSQRDFYTSPYPPTTIRRHDRQRRCNAEEGVAIAAGDDTQVLRIRAACGLRLADS